MSEAVELTDLAGLVTRYWGLEGAAFEPLDGGINSSTWLVRHQGEAYVAKQVPPHAVVEMVTGCEIASTLARAGIVTGEPVPTSDGRLVLEDQGLALLRYVPGRELGGDSDREQGLIASTLAAVHRAGVPRVEHGVSEFMSDWLSVDLPGVRNHDWLVRAIAAVRSETDGLSLTWSVLHTDPAPEAFVHDESTGVTGLVDWSGARRGPVLYDLASAVMYLGGRGHAGAFLADYLAQGMATPAEVGHLDAFSRFRECVQGTYFAKRLATDDRTGGVTPEENTKGLEDARRRLTLLTPAGGI